MERSGETVRQMDEHTSGASLPKVVRCHGLAASSCPLSSPVPGWKLAAKAIQGLAWPFFQTATELLDARNT